MQIDMYLNKILGFRDFTKLEEIKNEVKLVHQPASQQEDFDNARALIFFKTKRQQAWLIATNLALYCILDDIENDSFQIRWRLKKEQVVTSLGQLKFELELEPNYKEYSGLVNFGQLHKNWLYSKSLYPESYKLVKDFNDLVKTQMT